jgi:hypothetical protein
MATDTPLEELERREQNWFAVHAKYVQLGQVEKAKLSGKKWMRALDRCRRHPNYRDFAETVDL